VQAVADYNIGLRIEAVSISETLLPLYQSTTRHTPEDWIFINTSVKTPILYWNLTFKAVRMFNNAIYPSSARLNFATYRVLQGAWFLEIFKLDCWTVD
jgi:hypothetical protein